MSGVWRFSEHYYDINDCDRFRQNKNTHTQIENPLFDQPKKHVRWLIIKILMATWLVVRFLADSIDYLLSFEIYDEGAEIK